MRVCALCIQVPCEGVCLVHTVSMSCIHVPRTHSGQEPKRLTRGSIAVRVSPTAATVTLPPDEEEEREGSSLAPLLLAVGVWSRSMGQGSSWSESHLQNKIYCTLRFTK